MPQTLGEIRRHLGRYGLHPKHRFGQNFLHDHHALERIMQASAIDPAHQVLEVGPGTGTLTQLLLETGAQVTAVEIDRDLCTLLRELFAGPLQSGQLTLIEGDVLAGKHHLHPQIDQLLQTRPTVLVANLPYQIASSLLANGAIDYPLLIRAVVMVQQEVADRLLAGPGGGDYGPLGILIQAAFEVQLCFRLSPGCFYPRPAVDSAVVRLDRRPQPLSDDLPGFARLLQRVFRSRRKQLGSVLGRTELLELGIDPTRRAEQLSLDELLSLMSLPSQA